MNLSVIVPVFNAAHYLEEGLRSIIEQTCTADEIIVIDDGSTDHSLEIAQSFPEVSICKSITHAGPAAARNRGIELATGSFIAFHDADDICTPTRFEKQIALLRQQREASFCLCFIQNFVQPQTDVPQERLTPKLLAPRMGFISAGVFRREVFSEVGMFDESYFQGEDVEWLYRAQQASAQYALAPEVLIQRRLHSDNISNAYKEGHQSLFRMIRNRIKPDN